jgi:hypothetical protein
MAGIGPSVRLAVVAVLALALAGCSGEKAPENDQLEGAIRELAEAAAPQRSPSSGDVETVLCRLLETPSYDCSLRWADGVVRPFCAELRDGTVYMASSRDGCMASSRGQVYTRATVDDFG